MKKLPKTIYVALENAGTQDEYLQAETDAFKLTDGAVGIYQLKEVKEKSTETHLD